MKEHRYATISEAMPHFRTFFNKPNTDLGFRFLILGGAVGVAAGLAALGFHHLINWFHLIIFKDYVGGSGILRFFSTILSFGCVGVIVSGITRRFAPEAEGHGVPELMYAVAAKRSRLHAKVPVIKFLLSSLSIGVGFSVGREGPTALIGGAFGSIIGQGLKLSRKRLKMIVGCGTAGAIAAAFNAPLAGTAFALELVVGNFSLNYFGPIVLASVMGTLITRSFEGNRHALFADLSFGIHHPGEFLLIGLLGALMGLFGVLFTSWLYRAEDLVNAQTLPSWIKSFVLGILVGSMVFVMPFLSGPLGWEAIRYFMTVDPSYSIAVFAVILAFAKMIATILSLASGASGGLFAPSLLMGSSLGFAFGHVANSVVPASLQSPASYGLVAMGALIAAITQAPLTAITIVFELTNSYEIILPLIVALGASITVFNRLIDCSIYTLKLKRKGIDLQWGRDVGVLQSLSVREVADKESIILHSSDDLNMALEAFRRSSRTTLPVVDQKGKLVGICSLDRLEEALKKDLKSKTFQQDSQITVAALYESKVVFVSANQSLYEAFSKISQDDYTFLPVVNNQDERKLIGALHRYKLLQAYRNALEIRGIIESKA